MFSSLKLIINLCILLLLLLFEVNNNKIDAAKTKRYDCNSESNNNKVDECGLNIFPLTNENIIRKLPKTISDINYHCSTIRQYEQCIRDYAQNCLRNESKQTLSILMYSVGRVNKRYCSNKAKKQSLLNFIDCSGAENIKYYNQLLHNASAEIFRIQNYPDVKKRIPMMCCLYTKYTSIGLEHLEKHCPQNYEELDTMINSYSGDSLNFLCGDYADDSNKCDSILPLIPKKDTKDKNNNTKLIKRKSLILSMVQIIDSLQV